MTPDDDAIKGLLGKAFGPEPPLALDRDEVFRKGRRQVRIRRYATSGGVAAAVVAVVLGAATLSNLPGGEDVTPALSPVLSTTTAPPYPPTSPESAPQGPELPLSTTTTVKRLEDQHAAVLTQVLADAKIIPTGLEVRGPADGGKSLWFVFGRDEYRARADLLDVSGGGELTIAITRPDPRITFATCGPSSPPAYSCTMTDVSGVPMAEIMEVLGNGVISYRVLARRADGTAVTVTATNALSTQSGAVKPTRPKPPVEIEVLKRIAALPRLTFG